MAEEKKGQRLNVLLYDAKTLQPVGWWSMPKKIEEAIMKMLKKEQEDHG